MIRKVMSTKSQGESVSSYVIYRVGALDGRLIACWTMRCSETTEAAAYEELKRISWRRPEMRFELHRTVTKTTKIDEVLYEARGEQ